MSTKDKGYKPPTRDELQAMRDQKGVTPGPMLEAARRAQSIRDGLNSFADAIEKMADAYNRDDWKALGYPSWKEYCEGEFSGARVRLTVEQRKQAAASLAAAGLTKRAAAAALGVSHTTVQKDTGSGNKLPLAPAVDPIAAFDAKYSQDPSGDAHEGEPSPEVDSPAAQAHFPSSSSALEQPGPDSSVTSEAEAPAGRSGDHIDVTDDGVDPAIATGRPGIDPPVAPGEEPAFGLAVPPSASGQAGEAVEGGASPPPEAPPSTDPASEFMDRWRAFMNWLLTVDLDVLGPMLSDDEFSEMYGDIEGTLPHQIRALQKRRWNP